MNYLPQIKDLEQVSDFSSPLVASCFFSQKGLVLQKCASSYVLRRTADAIEREIPTKSYIDRLESRFPNTQINSLVKPGRKLSDYSQDALTYRYACINIARNSLNEILSELKEIKQLLNFRVEECEAATFSPDQAQEFLHDNTKGKA